MKAVSVVFKFKNTLLEKYQSPLGPLLQDYSVQDPLQTPCGKLEFLFQDAFENLRMTGA